MCYLSWQKLRPCALSTTQPGEKNTNTRKIINRNIKSMNKKAKKEKIQKNKINRSTGYIAKKYRKQRKKLYQKQKLFITYSTNRKYIL